MWREVRKVAEGIYVGTVVKHKANLTGGKLVVMQGQDTGHGYIEYECRWYNDKTGSYESGKFYDIELIGEKKD